MALNVKAAMLACIGFVAAMSWVISGIDRPQRTYRSPLIVAGEGAPLTLAGIGEDELLARPPARPADAPRFAHPNVFEREVRVSAAPEPLRIDSAAELARRPDRALPPLALDPPPADPDLASLAVRGPESGGPMVHLAEGRVMLASGEDLDPVADEPLAGLGLRTYRVARGDTLVRILRHEWNTTDPRLIELILDLNPGLRGRTDRILVGETLILPDAAAAAGVLAGDLEPREMALALRDVEPETGAFRWYTIRRNDSLTGIAQRLLNDSSRWREILELNRELDPHRIFPGDRIKLPPAGVRMASS